MGELMGTGTKIGIILILILVVVVIANLLDSEVQRGPSAEQQVTGKNASSAPSIRPARTVRPSPVDQRGKTRPVQARSLVTTGTPGRTSQGSAEVVKVASEVPEGTAAIRPAVSRDSEVGVSRATAVIRSGGEISSPVGSSATVSRPVAVPSPVPVNVVKKPVSSKLDTVTVRENDSLWSIASRHLGSGLRWSELLKVNPGLSERSILQPGQVLKIPTEGVVAKRPVAPVTPAVSVPAGFRSVVIREGDTLYDLAKAQLGSGLRWAEIRDANPGLNPDRLPVGKKILIPR